MLKMKMMILSVFLMSSLTAFAVMPPMPESEAIADSDLVILGKVLSVKDTGPTRTSGCTQRTPKQAKVKVLKTFKGKEFSEVQINFTKRVLKDGCVGHYFFGYSQNTQKKFYLRCEKNVCTPTFSGLIQKELIKK